MDRVFLKPIAKEILFKADEPNACFDSFEYEPSDKKNRHLGNLYIIGHLKYGEENMAYVLNLVSSLAKREYYSENGSTPEDPKKAFEVTLKKINDVLEDFFEKKDLKIDLGLVAVAGESIFISKLGKFKILLSRSGEMIDILNNVDLFQREQTEEKKFSNIVSGKIQDGDKLFAVYPTRQITAREKILKQALDQHGQEGFLAQLTAIQQSDKNFPCCGFHIEIKKRTESEIPIRSAYEKDVIAPETRVTIADTTRRANQKTENLASEEKAISAAEQPKAQYLNREQDGNAHIIPADMSVIKRKSLFGKIREKVDRQRRFNGFKYEGRIKTIGVVVVLFLAVLTGFKFISLIPDKNNDTINSAQENIKLAEVQINKNNSNSARMLLALSLSSLSSVKETNKKIEEVKAKIAGLLDKLDLVSDRQPTLLISDSVNKFYKIAAYGSDGLVALNADGKVYKINGAGAEELASPKLSQPPFVFLSDKSFALFNGSDQLEILNLNSKRYTNYKLKEAIQTKDAFLYEGNLYVLGENAIYKYPDATTGGVEKQLWLGGLTKEGKTNIVVDGNVYILHSDGSVIKYFKAKEEGRINLNIKVAAGSKLLTSKNSTNFYLVNFGEKKIRVFDKENGALVLTFKITQFDSLKDVSLGNKALYLASGQGQIWKIGLQ